MDTRHVPPREWTTFLRAFSREHADWEVTVEVERVNGAAPRRQRVVDRVKLIEIRLDGDGERGTRMAIRAAGGASEVRHVVVEPTIICFTELCTGPAAIQVDAPGVRTRVYVRPFKPVVRAPEHERYWDDVAPFDAGECELACARGARVAK